MVYNKKKSTKRRNTKKYKYQTTLIHYNIESETKEEK